MNLTIVLLEAIESAAALLGLANLNPADRLPVVPDTLHDAHHVVLVRNFVLLIDQVRVGSILISLIRTEIVSQFIAAVV